MTLLVWSATDRRKCSPDIPHTNTKNAETEKAPISCTFRDKSENFHVRGISHPSLEVCAQENAQRLQNPSVPFAQAIWPAIWQAFPEKA